MVSTTSKTIFERGTVVGPDDFTWASHPAGPNPSSTSQVIPFFTESRGTHSTPKSTTLSPFKATTAIVTAPSSSSSTSTDSYFGYYAIKEPVVTRGTTSWSTINLSESVLTNWLDAMYYAFPISELETHGLDPTAQASRLNDDVHQSDPPEWFKTMGAEEQSVFVSFWIPQLTTPVLEHRYAPLSDYDRVLPTQPPTFPGRSINATAVGFSPDYYDKSNDDKSNPIVKKVAVGMSVPSAAVLIFIFAWIIIRLRARRCQRDEEHASSPPHSQKSRKSSTHKPDYNAKPLFPHKPLARLSETSFTTDPAGPSYGSMSQGPTFDSKDQAAGLAELPSTKAIDLLSELQGSPSKTMDQPFELQDGRDSDNHLPHELVGSPTEYTSLLALHSRSNSTDFGTHFSGLEDPFSDDPHATVVELPSPISTTTRRTMTPGVSPSSYPLRDRLSHESGKRRQAIDAVKRSPSRRSSVGEEELKRLGRVFDSGDEEEMGKKGLKGSRSLGDIIDEEGGSGQGLPSSSLDGGRLH